MQAAPSIAHPKFTKNEALPAGETGLQRRQEEIRIREQELQRWQAHVNEALSKRKEHLQHWEAKVNEALQRRRARTDEAMRRREEELDRRQAAISLREAELHHRQEAARRREREILRVCKQVLAASPDWQEGWICAAQLQERLGLPIEAFHSYKQAFRRGDQSVAAAHALFTTLLDQQRYRAAERLLPMLEPHRERSRSLALQIGRLNVALGRPEPALALFGNDGSLFREIALSQQRSLGRPKLRPALRHVAIGGVSYIGSTIFGIVLGSIDGFANIGESHWLTYGFAESGDSSERMESTIRDGMCRLCGPACEVLSHEFREGLARDPSGWYDQIAAQLRTDFLVSSDKTLANYWRLDPTFAFDLVILYKPPESHLRSVKRATAQREARNKFVSGRAHEIGSVLQNWVGNYSGLMRTVRPRGRRVLLNWEEFVARPAEHFERLLKLLDLPGSAAVFDHIRPHHFIGGSGTAGVMETLQTGRFVARPSSAPLLSEDEMAAVVADRPSQSLFRRMENEYRRDFGDLVA